MFLEVLGSLGSFRAYSFTLVRGRCALGYLQTAVEGLTTFRIIELTHSCLVSRTSALPALHQFPENPEKWMLQKLQ